MTKEGLAKVIGWALNDEDFKEKMKADPENTAKDKACLSDCLKKT